MQQIIPFHQSTVDIHFKENAVVMTTKNVARLCLREPAVSPVIWNQRRVHIDDSILIMDEYQGKLATGYIQIDKQIQVNGCECLFFEIIFL